MATLNVLCGICSEYYEKSNNIYVTRCGHVFHQQCLFHWLRVSHTCPQCRQSCEPHKCHRIYLNFEPLREDELVSPTATGNFTTYDWLHIEPEMDEELLKTFAFHFGTDEDGNNIYAARGYYNGDLIPAYYCPQKRTVIAAWGFKSHILTGNTEILDISCDDAEYKWVSASKGALPDNALISGETIRQEPLYTARAIHEGRLLYGKLHRQYKMAYMPFGEEEISKSTYEILVRIPNEQSVVTNTD